MSQETHVKAFIGKRRYIHFRNKEDCLLFNAQFASRGKFAAVHRELFGDDPEPGLYDELRSEALADRMKEILRSTDTVVITKRGRHKRDVSLASAMRQRIKG